MYLPKPKNQPFRPPAGADHIYVRLEDGRHLQVRPMRVGGVALTIVGKLGGSLETAKIPIEAVPRTIHLIDGASEISWRARERIEARRQKELDRRLRKAHEANPFRPEYKGLNPGRFKGGLPVDGEYLVRPR